eukprot:CAMPEP_0115071692 /NCGR_PEP_ID=MMETSP0227-20121206/13813_1 /TAXON_ID=89957 /ORGANISM="Polarella glacialis, Strain CCMP 1383" /LENGTH=170 /DNA_ID=CAMNT_0002458351 /DNA_START=182 /DNA_END=694 /DNA_ORIENTATION=-
MMRQSEGAEVSRQRGEGPESTLLLLLLLLYATVTYSSASGDSGLGDSGRRLTAAASPNQRRLAGHPSNYFATFGAATTATHWAEHKTKMEKLTPNIGAKPPKKFKPGSKKLKNKQDLNQPKPHSHGKNPTEHGCVTPLDPALQHVVQSCLRRNVGEKCEGAGLANSREQG